jgi:hypothetical protein
VDEFLPRLGILDENAYYKNSAVVYWGRKNISKPEKKLGLRVEETKYQGEIYL